MLKSNAMYVNIFLIFQGRYVLVSDKLYPNISFYIQSVKTTIHRGLSLLIQNGPFPVLSAPSFTEVYRLPFCMIYTLH